jgi:hypothetical protein
MYLFQARDLQLVMGPAAPGTSVRFRVLIDDQAPGAAHRVDVDDQDHRTLSEQQLHPSVRQPQPIADQLFEIEFLDAEIAAYTLTFDWSRDTGARK